MRIQDIILLIAAVFLITLVAVQASKDSVSNAFSGEKSELFKNQKQRGSELFMSRITAFFSIAFFGAAIWAMI